MTVLTRDQVFHVRGLSNDGVVGLSPIACGARRHCALGLAAQSYGARFFQNDARPGRLDRAPWQTSPRRKRAAVPREQFQELQGGMNRGKAAVLEYGMKLHEVTVSNDDAQFLETRKFQVSEIARLFRIPPHMIGDLEKATFSNIEQQSIEYVMHTLTPWLVRWEEAIEYTFLGADADQDLMSSSR
jgi:HK97 family phage portal protein